jgi:L-fuculokinase
MGHYTSKIMHEKIIIILDCGATNIRAIAVNQKGEIVAAHAVPNNTKPDPFYPSGLIWDVDEIWEKFIGCAREVVMKINAEDVEAITVTTFGVNGAPVDKNGKLLYPVISWQCNRTIPIMNSIDKYFPLQKLYQISGVYKFSFNTINVLIWLKENHPKIIEQMHCFLFIPSLFIHRLTGEMINDITMLGTSMLADIKQRNFSAEILNALEIPNKFVEIADAGTIVGKLTKEVASDLGFFRQVPVVLGGHDTQFALIGSGAEKNDVVLSSGTWEILMTRSSKLNPSKEQLALGITNELDIVPGLYNSGVQWIASGILEWLKHNFYSIELKQQPNNIYDIMNQEAQAVTSSSSINVDLDFIANNGSISGLGLHTSRGEIYKSMLLAFSKKLKNSLDTLQDIGEFKADSLIVVGGGAKNRLWNQYRANALGIPLKIVRRTETTAIGAAAVAFSSIGVFESINEGITSMCKDYDYVNPEGKNNSFKS